MKTPRSCGRRNAFTLMELLVVIAIIAILASILIPTMGSSRERARTAYCANNLNQLGKALIGYADEHKDFLPAVSKNGSESFWDIALLPYVGFATNLFLCPSDPFRTDAPNLRSYSANGGYNNDGFTVFKPPFGGYSEIPPPLRMRDIEMHRGDIILISERPGDSTANRGYLGVYGFCGLDQVEGSIHKGGKGANYLMSSLSVQYFEPQTINTNTLANYWNLKIN